VTLRHGTLSGYRYHSCRCSDCLGANQFYKKRNAVDVARNGPRVVDKTPLLRVLNYAAACGIAWSDIGSRAGVNRHVADPTPRVNRSSRDAVLRALEEIVAAQASALDDLRSAIEFARGSQPVRRQGQRTWPTAPLREAIDRRWPIDDRKDGLVAAPPLSEADRRYLYRFDVLDEARADRLCNELGLCPEDVWAGWFQLEEAS